MAAMEPQRARMISVIAATIISLACGTNYIYSAWAPQYAQRLKLSSTQSNLIGTFGNLGMYASGIPLGMMVDRKGPRWGVAVAIILFGAGYYPIARAYDAGPGVYSVASMCLFSFFTGSGSASAFSAAIKTSALNYPDSRGTATAFPLAAFGLSAFFFATLAWAVPHDTSHFLLLLATGTVVMPIVAFPFVRILPPHAYKSLPQYEGRALHRTRSSDDPIPNRTPNTGAQDDTFDPSSVKKTTKHPLLTEEQGSGDEHSSLLSGSSNEVSADLMSSKLIDPDEASASSHLDVRGFALLPHPEFWQLFCMLGLMTGIGLMTINNIGNDAQALWKHYNPDVSDAYIAKRQVMHVSIISVCSFTGRLLSGIGSDVLVKRFDRSRFWCLFASALTFSAAQLLGVLVKVPTQLVFVSGLTGLAYGVLFGVYPSLVAHTFGVNGLSQNWGTMTLAPVISGNIFNILYGRIYDSHSIVGDEGGSQCLEGVVCYSGAYWLTFGASLAAIALCLWSIHHENMMHKSNKPDRKRSDHERLA